jgi:hypothetical protein
MKMSIMGEPELHRISLRPVTQGPRWRVAREIADSTKWAEFSVGAGRPKLMTALAGGVRYVIEGIAPMVLPTVTVDTQRSCCAVLVRRMENERLVAALAAAAHVSASLLVRARNLTEKTFQSACRPMAIRARNVLVCRPHLSKGRDDNAGHRFLEARPEAAGQRSQQE